MWAALKSDLTEFVSTVADESTNVLATIDDKLTDDDAVRQNVQDENGGMVIGVEDGNIEFASGGFDDTGLVASAKDEASRLMGHSETFLVPIDPTSTAEEGDQEGGEMDDAYYVELQDFLADWDVEQKTDEIAKLLEEHPDTLKVQFEELVPTQVKYEDFWQRYFFRCDEERITKNWEIEQERKREARKRAISGGLTAAKNLFGGAVKALKETTTITNTSEPPTHPYTASPQQTPGTAGGSGTAAGLGASLFGAGGRPPFVMNTAVDEDEDSDENNEEDEEEEEELGWDDDDEDFDSEGDGEEEEDGGSDEDDGEDDKDDDEVIDFTSNELDDLKQQYTQAVEERDSLHETVEMQKKVIMELQAGKTDALPDSPSSDKGSSPPIINTNNEEMEKLKLEIFEKNSELAAIKANLDDQGDHSQKIAQKMAIKVAEHQTQVTSLTEDLLAKELELTKLQESLETKNVEIDKFRAETEMNMKEAESKRLADIEQLQNQLEAAKAEIGQLQSQSQTQTADLDSKIQDEVMALRAELTRAKQDREEMILEMEQLRKQSESTQMELDETLGKLKSNEIELSQTQEQITEAADKMGDLLNQAQSDKAEIEQLRSQSEAHKQTWAGIQGHNTELQSELDNLQGTLQAMKVEKDSLQAEKDSLHGALTAARAESGSGNEEIQRALAATQAQVDELTKELEEVKAKLEFTTRRADGLDGELFKAQQILIEKEAEFSSKLEEEVAKARAEATPHDCTSSESTSGVKVPPVESAPVVTKLEDDDDDDADGDGWGDDWSDDDI